eukprot:scaffold142991_cov130-Phaeocystis_antarctica.AAC.4
MPLSTAGSWPFVSTLTYSSGRSKRAAHTSSDVTLTTRERRSRVAFSRDVCFMGPGGVSITVRALGFESDIGAARSDAGAAPTPSMCTKKLEPARSGSASSVAASFSSAAAMLGCSSKPWTAHGTPVRRLSSRIASLPSLYSGGP